MFFYRTITAIFIGLWLAVFVIGNKTESAPNLASYFINELPTDDVSISKLAKNDVIILSADKFTMRKSIVDRIRQKNPNIIMLAYVPSQSYNTQWWPQDYIFRNMTVKNSWWLRDGSGNIISTWPNTKNINMTKEWSEYLVNFTNQHVLTQSNVDGIFFDVISDVISWANNGNIDIDNDGLVDSKAKIDANWLSGTVYLLQYAQNHLNTKYIVTNGSSNLAMQPYINGRMFETWPTPWDHNGDWGANMNDLRNNQNYNLNPKLYIINANTHNTGNKADYRNMRFGLGSSLLVDNTYFSFDYGDQSHGQVWWYDEYNVNLGNPTESAVSQSGSASFKDDVWRRNYENGLALVNSTNNYQTIELGTEYEKIKGTQDTSINDGSIVSSVNMQPKDGLVMLKSLQGTGKSQTVDNIIFDNGDFMRFYDMNGNRVRNGFFVFDENYPGGTKIFEGDLDGHKEKNEKIVIEDNFRIYLYNDSGNELMYRYPFGANYNSRMNLAVGSAFGDPDKEIMISSSNQDKIMVFNYYGLNINKGFYPLGETSKVGPSLAIGNVNGGARGENILAFKNGNTDEVMIYNFRFSQLLKRFTVGYGAKDILVASGDLTGNGIDEIIVGLIINGKTVIKTFDFNAHKLAEFSVQTGFGGDLTGLATLDVNYDGKKDIVFMSR